MQQLESLNLLAKVYNMKFCQVGYFKMFVFLKSMFSTRILVNL